MNIAVLKETRPGERRVALVPESCKKLMQPGYAVSIEAGAGEAAGFTDEAYTAVGVTIASDPAALTGAADLVFKVNAPSIGGDRDEVAWMRPGAIYLGSLMPLRNLDGGAGARRAQGHGLRHRRHPAHHARAVDGHAVVAWPTSPATRACCSPPSSCNRYFPMLTTAAGMVPPAKVFVIGAGVAGLQAIATARRLGANVVATDVRPEVKEQIESVGAKYVGIELERERGGRRRLRQGAVRRGPGAPGASCSPSECAEVRRRHHHGAHRRRLRAAAHHGRHRARR